jgi:peptide/nickel transport system permease protein
MSAPLPDLLAAPGAVKAAPARKRARGTATKLRIWLPLGFLVLLAAACFIWPQIYPVPKPVGGSILEAGLPPFSPGHILGTDPNGNDVPTRASCVCSTC